MSPYLRDIPYRPPNRVPTVFLFLFDTPYIRSSLWQYLHTYSRNTNLVTTSNCLFPLTREDPYNGSLTKKWKRTRRDIKSPDWELKTYKPVTLRDHLVISLPSPLFNLTKRGGRDRTRRWGVVAVEVLSGRSYGRSGSPGIVTEKETGRPDPRITKGSQY